MSNTSSPGSSGFTAAFLNFFWSDLGHFLVRSINHGFETGELSVTQKQGIITCIPKGDKDKMYLKNWRPISLLNVSYKIASSCIANRLKTVLHKIISEDQTGFLSGRFMGENIRLLYDIMFYTEKYNKPGMLLLLDFATAFDSLSWKFMNNVLDFFNFGTSFKKWIELFYKNIQSCVVVNGHMSDWFYIYRGCRQGDPLSPYLFILCAEILALLIKTNKNITGIKVEKNEFIISQYADDTTLMLDGSEKSLRNTMQVLKFYADISGLNINMDKTKAVWIGSKRESENRICRDLNLKWDTEFKLLGVFFSVNLNSMAEINYTSKIIEIKHLFLNWSKRILSPIGKNVVIKTLALSKLNHLIIGLPNPKLEIIKTIQNMFFEFIWNGSPDKIKRNVITNNYDCGGLRVVDLAKFMDALKVTWIKRCSNNCTKYAELVKFICPFMSDFWTFGCEYIKNNVHHLNNEFWKDVWNGFTSLSLTALPKSWEEFLSLPIWFNQMFKIAGRSFCDKKYLEKGIVFINDLMDRNGRFLTFEDFKNKYSVQTNFLQFNNIIHSLRSFLDSLNIVHKAVKLTEPIQPFLAKFLNKTKKGCRIIYDSMLLHSISVPVSQRKWSLEFNFNEQDWKNIYKLPFVCTKDPKLQWLQYRINHRIIGTNHLLSKMSLRDNSNCSFCAMNPETITHLFWECEFSQNFLQNAKTFIKEQCNLDNLVWTKADVIFGLRDSQKALNNIMMTIKLHIYQSKMKSTLPNLEVLKKQLVSLINTERFNAQKTMTLEKFDVIWGTYKPLCADNGE
jgi:hypothetical protein